VYTLFTQNELMDITYKLNWLRIHGENWYGTKRKFYKLPVSAILLADDYIVDRNISTEFWRENANESESGQTV